MRRYLVSLLVLVPLLAGLAAGVNVLIDPYDIWGAAKVDGVNRYKPELGRHMKLAKSRQYMRVRPATVIAGNSRVEVGFDPADSVWADARPVYNLGLPGHGVEGVAQVLAPLADAAPPKRVILALDFLDFRISEADWRRAAPVSWRNHARMTPRKLAETVLSIDALLDSARTVWMQGARYPATTTPFGFNGLSEYRGLVAREGHYALFDQRNRENIAGYLAGPKRIAWPEAGANPAFTMLDALAARLGAAGVEVTLVTFPYHADILVAFEETGLWPAYEAWKRRIATLDAPVWDFGVYHAYTTEAVPPRGDRTTAMNWYWEAGHFKAALGREMIARINGGGRDGFGVRLAPDTVGAHLAAIRAAARDYRAAHPGDVARITALVKRAMSR